jgi:hypothetical protein
VCRPTCQYTYASTTSRRARRGRVNLTIVTQCLLFSEVEGFELCVGRWYEMMRDVAESFIDHGRWMCLGQ